MLGGRANPTAPQTFVKMCINVQHLSKMCVKMCRVNKICREQHPRSVAATKAFCQYSCAGSLSLSLSLSLSHAVYSRSLLTYAILNLNAVNSDHSTWSAPAVSPAASVSLPPLHPLHLRCPGLTKPVSRGLAVAVLIWMAVAPRRTAAGCCASMVECG